jgi:hypothetical protein
VEQRPGPLTCGRPIPYPTADQADGFSLTLKSLRRDAPDGPPQVSFTINAPEPVGLNPTEVYPTVLLLRDGIVVGGPIPPGVPGRVQQLPLYLWEPGPGGSVLVEELAQPWLCGMTSWGEVWAQPNRYDLAIVMTPPTTDPGPANSESGAPSKPLLMASSSLDALAIT